MAVTSAERKEIISRLTAFNENVKEVKERFYRFLVENYPKGYVQYILTAYPNGYPLASEVFELRLEEDEGLYFEKTSEEPGEYYAYMSIPDAYLDDPDAWEERVLAELAIDRKMAKLAVETVFGLGWEDIKYRTERSTTAPRGEFVDIIFDNDSIPSRKWIIFMDLTPLNQAVISINRKTGAIFEGSARREYNAPEPENKGFMGYAE